MWRVYFIIAGQEARHRTTSSRKMPIRGDFMNRTKRRQGNHSHNAFSHATSLSINQILHHSNSVALATYFSANLLVFSCCEIGELKPNLYIYCYRSSRTRLHDPREDVVQGKPQPGDLLPPPYTRRSPRQQGDSSDRSISPVIGINRWVEWCVFLR